MKQLLIVKFLNGREEEVSLLHPFHPRDMHLRVELNRCQEQVSIPLEELCYIMVIDSAGGKLPVKAEDLVEQIETITGDRFELRVPPNQKHKSGFFTFPLEQRASFRSIFFTFSGIRQRCEARPLSDILEERGWLPENVIGGVLDEQEKLRSRKVGEIIAAAGDLPADKIDEVAKQVRAGEAGQRVRIGDLLIQSGLVSRDEVENALQTQSVGKKKRVGELLIEKGLITEEQLLIALSTKFRIPVVDLITVKPTKAALAALSKEMVIQLNVLPLSTSGRRLSVAISDPTDPTVGDNLRFLTNMAIDFVAAPASAIEEAIETYYGHIDRDETNIANILGDLADEHVNLEDESDEQVTAGITESDSQIITLVNSILLDGFRKGASDLHFEPGLGNQPLQVRYRIDGICTINHKIANNFKKAIISRIKIIAKLDIAERRRPQSGKIVMRSDRRKIEFRVETTPTAGGQEDAVLRILSSSQPLKLTEMGLTEKNRLDFVSMLEKPYGIVLCVGPTGSGKTTTLHSALGHINTPARKIWTAEDPVEITQPGLRQVQINPKIGFTFDQALRSFLRSDPDVIMIGEMRDPETAKIAIDASLTGHLVFSTLHTNNSAETVVRLIEMGMDPFNFANSLLGILAQRLARRICNSCREAYQPSAEELELLIHHYGEDYYQLHDLPQDPTQVTLYRAKGCENCQQTGYLGRMAVHELLVAAPDIRRAIKEGKMFEELRDMALKNGMRTLMMDGIGKILSGHTDLEQVLRVCM
jgi:type II secretory ATPase GspE/PulE/Tfp pilus assembly ATPase PilB-like protein